MRNKIILILLVICFMAVPAFAGKDVKPQKLRVDGRAVENLVLTSGRAVTTDSVRVRGNVGFMTLIVTEDIAGGAGDVDIYAEYATTDASSADSVWSKAYTTSSGTLSVDSNIVTQLGNTRDAAGVGESRWIVFTPRLSPYIRFVLDPDANSEVTVDLLYQEEY